MKNIIQALRRSVANSKTRRAAAGIIERQDRVLNQAASLLAEASLSEDGIDTQAAEECIAAIRGCLDELGKTTHEHHLEKLHDGIAAAAGIPRFTEFNPLLVLEHIRVTLAAQAKNAKYLSWALDVLWSPGSDKMKPRLITSTGCGCCGDSDNFPIGTTWVQALDRVMAAESAGVAAAPGEQGIEATITRA